MTDHKPRPRRSKATLQDIADIRDALDLAADRHETGQAIYDKAGSCSEPQSSAVGIAIIGQPRPKSLHRI